jgi:hypothetical protein
MPTLFHMELTEVCFEKKTIDVSDGVGNTHNVSVELDPDSKCIKVESNVSGLDSTITFSLNREAFSQNGIFLYSYDLPDCGEFEDFYNSTLIPGAIYHLSKSFYHEHMFHDSLGDSMINAYVSDEYINIQAQDNKALMHFLCSYENRLIAFSEEIKYQFDYLERENLNPDDKYVVFIEKRKSLDSLCSDVLGETLFCESLLNSTYNHSFKINPETDSDYRRKAINLHNAVNCIRMYQSRNRENFEFKNARLNLELSYNSSKSLESQSVVLDENDKISKRGLKIGLFGLITGIVSLIASIISIFLS